MLDNKINISSEAIDSIYKQKPKRASVTSDVQGDNARITDQPASGDKVPESITADEMQSADRGMDKQTDQKTDQQPDKKLLKQDKKGLKSWQKIVLVCLILVLGLVAAGAAAAFVTLGVAQDLRTQATELQTLGRAAYDQFKSQNLPGTDQSLKEAQAKLQQIRTTYQKLSFFKFVPVVSTYYQDGIHGLNAADAGMAAALKSVEAVVPYADVLGFKGEGTFAGGTAEDRLKTILQTLQKVTPELDKIAVDLKVVEQELAQIDEKHYPEQVAGKQVRARITQVKGLSMAAATALTDFRPVIEQLPSVAGSTGKRRKYLILLLNNNELRPTGGFQTAYAVIYVEDGKVTLDKSDDIYQLDKKFSKKKLAIPPILGKYLTTEKYYNLRDMNIYPDFKQSIEEFLTHYKEVPGEPTDIDGVIAIDTEVITNIIKVLGPVEVPGYGTFSAEITPKCDCPQIIYALSEIADRPTPYIREDRKGILGPMARQILTKAYTAPKTQWPQLFEIAWQQVQGRHVQFYFFDEQFQAAAERVGAAGRLQLDPKAEDFLAIIDANLGGAKSNLFVKTEALHEVSLPENGTITNKLTLTYENTRAGDNCNLEAGLLCLNATLRDWNRLYLPAGAKLVKAEGYKQGSVREYQDGEFTVIEGEFILQPKSQAKLRVEYTVPYKNTSQYSLKLWKQGGTDPIKFVIDVNGNQSEVSLDKDVLFNTSFN